MSVVTDVVGTVTMLLFDAFLILYAILMVASFWEIRRETTHRIKEQSSRCQGHK